MKKKILLCLVLVLLATGAFAQNPYYETGDQVFNVELGLQVPDFVWFPYAAENNYLSFKDTRMSLGGWGSISYSAFATNRIALGGELGYGFSFSNAHIIFSCVPVSLKLTWVPVQTGTFDLAVVTNVGGSFNSYNSELFLGPFMGISLIPTYYFHKNWGLGLKIGFSTTSEFYFPSSSRQQYTAIAGLSPISFSLSYRH